MDPCEACWGHAAVMLGPIRVPGLESITEPSSSTNAIAVEPSRMFSLKVNVTDSGMVVSTAPSAGFVDTNLA